MTNQYVLPLKDPDRHFVAGAKVRAACLLVADAVGHKAVATAWGCHEHTVALKIKEHNRNSIHPHEMLALKELDENGLIDAAEKEARVPAVTDEVKMRRLPGILREYVAEGLAQLIERRLEQP